MPLIHITADQAKPRMHAERRSLPKALHEGLESPGPAIIMIHGFKFDPRQDAHCPHKHILSLDPQSACWKAISWPRELGFGTTHDDEGLGLSFGWSARGTIWQAYRMAAHAGYALAELIHEIKANDPERAIHLFCHSLGARVALSALQHLSVGSVQRVILLNAAEYSSNAAAALASPAGQSVELFNITSRENDIFDFMMERVVAPPERGDRMLAHGLTPQRNTLTVQLDNFESLKALNAHGFPIAKPKGRICHWSAYLRPGVFSLYRALLRHPNILTQGRLRQILPERHDPRWSRVLSRPNLTQVLPLRRDAPL